MTRRKGRKIIETDSVCNHILRFRLDTSETRLYILRTNFKKCQTIPTSTAFPKLAPCRVPSFLPQTTQPLLERHRLLPANPDHPIFNSKSSPSSPPYRPRAFPAAGRSTPGTGHRLRRSGMRIHSPSRPRFCRCDRSRQDTQDVTSGRGLLTVRTGLGRQAVE